MKIIVLIALFISGCLALTNCPTAGASTFFQQQTFLAVSPTSFSNPNLVTRDFATGKGYINIADKLIAAFGYDIRGVKSDNNVDLSVDAIAFVMNVLTETTVAWFYADAAVDIDIVGGNVSFVGAKAGFLGFAHRAFGIVEYVNTNGISGFQTNDTVLGGYDLASDTLGLQWCNIDVDVYNVTDANGVLIKVRSASVITVDNVFGFRVTSIGTYGTIDGVKVDPNTIKIDFIINYYNNSYFVQGDPFARGNSPSNNPNAQIALVTGFAAVAAGGEVGVFKSITQDPSGNSGTGVAYGVSAGASGAAAGLYSYYTYAQNAQVQVIGGGYIKAGVVATKTLLANPTGNGYWNIAQTLSEGAYAKWGTVDLAIFSFEQIRPSQVYWDPSLGGNTPNFAGTYSSSLLLMAILAILFALF